MSRVPSPSATDRLGRHGLLGTLAIGSAVALSLAAGSAPGWLSSLPQSAVAPLQLLAVSAPFGVAAAVDGTDVEELIDAVERVADGEYDVSVDVDRDDELGSLADAVDEMADTVAEREDGLESEIEYTDDVLDEIDDVFYVLDREGEHRQWNDTLAEVTGYDHEEVAELHPLDYFEGEDESAIAAGIAEAFEEGHARAEAALRTKSGESIPYEWIANRLRAPDGTPVVAGIGRDVSARRERERELRRNERRFEAVFNDPNLLARVVAPDGTLIDANEHAMEMVDADRDDLVGEPFWELPWWAGDESLQSEIREGIERAASGEYVEYEAEHAETDTVAYYASAGTIRPVFDDDGDVSSMIVSSRDVTERKERECELREARDRLAANNDALQRLSEIGAEKDASLEEKIQAMLDLGRERLGLSGAFLSRIGEDETRFELVQTSGIPDVETGTVVPISETFCRKTATATGVFTVTDAPNQGWEDDPAYQRWGFHTYVGGRVFVEDELAGTIGFVDETPTDGFSDDQLTFVDLATQWVGFELERRRKEERLEEHTQFTDAILDSMDDLFYAVGPSGTLRRWNDALEAATGYDGDEIGSMNPIEFVVGEDEEIIAGAVQETFETGTARAEARVLTKGGEAVPYEFVGSLLEDPEGDPVLVGVGRDVTDRVERERELQRTRYLLRQAQEIAHVGGWEMDVRSEPYSFEVTDEFYAIHDVSPEEPLDTDRVLELYHPDDRDRIQRLITAAIEEGTSYDMEVRLASTDAGDRWIRAIAEPVVEDGEVVALRGSVQDITDRKEQQLRLQSLHDVARGLLEAESRMEIATLVRDAAETVIGVPCIALYLFDETTGKLEPEATSASFEEICRTPTAGLGAEDDSVLWETYVGGEVRELNGSEIPELTASTAEAHETLIVPIGEYGVLLAASAGTSIEPADRRVAETLAATMETALHRLDSEAALRENQRQLEAQNSRLRRQMQITEIIRQVDRSIVGASTREEIESAVCERLVESDDVAFAWIGALDDRDRTVVPRAWAGAGSDYLDAVELDADAERPDPAVRAAVTGSPSVVESVVESVTAEQWRKHALVWEFSSVIAVPLVFDEYSYGVLTVYGTDPGAFGELERDVFEELGESIANAINAVEAQRALYADEFVELRLHLDGDEEFLGRVAAESGATVEYVGLATHTDEESQLFFETSGADPASVRSVLDGLHTVTDYRQIGEPGRPTLFEATVAGTVLAAHLVSRGGVPREIVAEGDRIEIVVDVPTAIDVREFVEMLRERYRSVELLGRRDVTRDVETRQELVAGLFDGLTDRQLEVLRTAFFAGFFEWPRESTGEEVAELLGVSQPTVNRHVRHGLARILEQLFEEEPTVFAEA